MSLKLPLAAALTAAVVMAAPLYADAQGNEKCYGISLAGNNDCATRSSPSAFGRCSDTPERNLFACRAAVPT